MSYTFTSPIKNINNNESLASCSSVRRTLNDIFENSKTILMVGWRQDSDAAFVQHILSSDKKLTIVEVFPENLKNVPSGVTGIYSDIRDYQIIEKYDLFLWQHGPEHVQKSDAIKFLNQNGNMFKYIVLESPNGPCTQDINYGNPYEEHVSTWIPSEYEELGFDYITYAGEKNNAFVIGYKIND